MDSTEPVTTKQQVGRYKLIEELGQGALSVVYKAFDPTINRVLAVKVLHEEQAADPVSRQRFLTEAKAASNLTHANIVTIFDIGEDDKIPYIAMEYLEGETLEEVINSGEKLSTQDIINIGTQLAEALDYSHNQGVVHRDIKPGNIIISKDRQRIRITDFGIALVQQIKIELHTKMGSFLGTPHYLSPEQIEGLDVDGRSDLFSTGIILYQLIVGEKPFTAPTLTQLLMQIVQNKAPKLKDKAPDILPDLHKIVDKLQNKDQRQRYQTGAELADALQSALSAWERREKKLEKRAKRMGITTFPLPYKWSAIVAVALLLTLTFSALFIHDRQVDSMSRLSQELGEKLAKFVAMESAEAVLAQDWIAIEVLAKDAQKHHGVNYLDIKDINGVSRGGETQRLSAQGYITTIDRIPAVTADNILVSEKSREGKSIFEFGTPILFQGNKIGWLHLGLPKTSLKEASAQTMTTLLLLLPVILVIILGIVWLLTSRLTASLIKLTSGLDHINQKRYNVRLKEARYGDLSHLFTKFNSMAEALEHEQEERKPSDGAIDVPLKTLEASLDELENNDLPDKTPIDEEPMEQQGETESEEFKQTLIRPTSPTESTKGISERDLFVGQK